MTASKQVGDWMSAFSDVGEAERRRWDEWVRRHLQDDDFGDGGIPMVFELWSGRRRMINWLWPKTVSVLLFMRHFMCACMYAAHPSTTQPHRSLSNLYSWERWYNSHCREIYARMDLWIKIYVNWEIFIPIRHSIYIYDGTRTKLHSVFFIRDVGFFWLVISLKFSKF